ncbi:hypothetical protein BD414DRAFT_320754 [Trametes punicea]|nr:hypothetical protein BD414DRAFT_320754 [Trametes punicea]
MRHRILLECAQCSCIINANIAESMAQLLPLQAQVEWNAEKEQILWEVIAKSRAIEGAGTDWKGLASHLQVPLPYLLYRAQARYEEDLRGLQGLGIRPPVVPFPSAPSPHRANPSVEYYPNVTEPTRPPISRRDSVHGRIDSSSSGTGGLASTSGTVPGTSTLRPMGVRARLSSLGHARAHSGATVYPPRPAKKISSSSTITLQGSMKARSPKQLLSPASSRAGTSSDGGDEDFSESDEDDEEARKEEEAERQENLTRKLQDLERIMTKDALGLVADSASLSARANGKQRGRSGPLSRAHASGVSLSSLRTQRSPSGSNHGNQSLSSASVDSPQGSIPSIPSPSANTTAPRNQQQQHSQPQAHESSSSQTADLSTHQRHPNQSSSPSLSTSQSVAQSRSSHCVPRSPPRVTSPKPVRRHLGPPEKSPSPPTLSPSRARGQTHVQNLRQAAAGLAAVSTGTASEASSFSDLSDADLSGSALESAMMSNTRGAGSRFSSFARSHLTGGRRTARG